MKTIDRVPRDESSFVNFCKENNAEVYIFGADITGKILNLLLKSKNIKVKGFIDNNRNKCNVELSGVSVFHADELATIDKNAVFLIASTYISDIIRQLEDIGFYNWVPIDEILDDYSPNQLSELLKGDLRKNHTGGEFTKDFDVFVINNMVNSQKKYLDEKQLYV